MKLGYVFLPGRWRVWAEAARFSAGGDGGLRGWRDLAIWHGDTLMKNSQ